jgi:hypothetical protein
MPQDYGFNPQAYQAGKNPWYNPMMQHPDVGAGIRDILNKIWGYREYKRKEAEEQRRWEADYELQQKRAEGETEQRRAMAEYYKDRNAPAAPPPFNREAVMSFVEASDLPDGLKSVAGKLTDDKLEGLYNVVMKRLENGQKVARVTPPAKDTERDDFLKNSAIYVKDLTERIRKVKDGLPEKGAAGAEYKTIGTLLSAVDKMRTKIIKKEFTPDDLTYLEGISRTLETPMSPTSIPPEVLNYLQNHPGANSDFVLKNYQKYLKTLGK